jgi:hypothetical protein
VGGGKDVVPSVESLGLCAVDFDSKAQHPSCPLVTVEEPDVVVHLAEERSQQCQNNE